jgi:hypothetical protein
MNQRTDVSQVFNTFVNLLTELELFADVSDLKLAFDQEGNAFLLGSDFQQRLHSNLTLHREVKAELRQIIAERCTRISLEMAAQSKDAG